MCNQVYNDIPTKPKHNQMSSYSIPVFLTQVPREYETKDINRVFESHGIQFQDVAFKARLEWKRGFKYGFGTLCLPDHPNPTAIRIHTILMQNHEFEWNLDGMAPLRVALLEPRWKRKSPIASQTPVVVDELPTPVDTPSSPFPEWFDDDAAPDDFLLSNPPAWISNLLDV